MGESERDCEFEHLPESAFRIWARDGYGIYDCLLAWGECGFEDVVGERELGEEKWEAGWVGGGDESSGGREIR